MDDEIVVNGSSGPIGVIDWGGSGDPFLLVHGGGTNAAQWAPVVPHLQGYRCVSLDLPGHGRTPDPTSRPFSDLWLEMLDAVIAHFDFPRERLSLVGGSFGGALAVWYAGQRPGLRGVVSIDAAPYAVFATSPQRPEPLTAEQYRADGWGWTGDEVGYEANVAEMVADGCPEHCARRKHVLLADGRHQVRPTAEFLAATPDPENPLMEMDGAMYGKLGCPALLVYGNEGTAAHNQEYIDAMPDRFPMVSVTWVDGPHDLDWDRPELVAEHVTGFPPPAQSRTSTWTWSRCSRMAGSPERSGGS
jgi:pimeloyl-ACP methyl ester carboxylesterase